MNMGLAFCGEVIACNQINYLPERKPRNLPANNYQQLQNTWIWIEHNFDKWNNSEGEWQKIDNVSII